MTPQQSAAIDVLEAAAVAVIGVVPVAPAWLTAVGPGCVSLRAELTPAPPVDPPVEPPAPVPPPPAPPSALELVPLGSGARILAFRGYHESGATYDRFQRMNYWTGATAVVTMYRHPQVSGPVFRPARTYPLSVDGQPKGQFVFAEGAAWAQVTINTASLPSGWLRLQVDGAADGEVNVPGFAYLDRGQVQPALMPVYEGSHKHPTDPTHLEHAITWTPTSYTPAIAPLPRREYPPVTASTRVRAQCVTRPERSVNMTIPNANKAGVVNTHGMQSYFWYHQLDRYPVVPLLDGPRGYATHPLTTHMQAGAAAMFPGGPLMHTFYFSDPWRISRGREDGSTATLVGYRHNGMASYWEDGAAQKTLELVGDWSAIPADRRGLWNVRSFCWDEASLAVDATAAPIPEEQGRQPHIVAPVMYVAEQRESGKGSASTGRILRVEFNARAHDTPAKVTEVATGLPGPWGIVDDGARLIVSLRNASRLIAIDKATGAQTVLAQGNALMATVTSTGIPTLTGTLADRRAQVVLAPECLKIQDGYLYVGSYAAECVTRFDLATMQRDPSYMLPVLMTAKNSWFVEFAISDGGFGPRGTIFAQTWGQSHHAGVYGTQPDGAKFTAHVSAAPWDKGQGYPCAVATFGGRLYTVASNLGITRYGAATPDDMTINATTYLRGELAWDTMHGDLRYGSMGFGNHGVPLPWGLNPDIDHYLSAHDAPGA